MSEEKIEMTASPKLPINLDALLRQWRVEGERIVPFDDRCRQSARVTDLAPHLIVRLPVWAGFGGPGGALQARFPCRPTQQDWLTGKGRLAGRGG